jgi:hypothetical protein
MQKVKYILLIGILQYSGNLFSQKINYNELLGTWKWGSGKRYFILTFESNTIYSQDVIYGENYLSYILDSSNEIYVLRTPNTDPKGSLDCRYWLKKDKEGNFRLQ